jgi:hypothetical protein
LPTGPNLSLTKPRIQFPVCNDSEGRTACLGCTLRVQATFQRRENSGGSDSQMPP